MMRSGLINEINFRILTKFGNPKAYSVGLRTDTSDYICIEMRYELGVTPDILAACLFDFFEQSIPEVRS